MDTYLSTSSTSDRLESLMQKDSIPYTDNDSHQIASITNAGIRELALRLSATLPYRSRRQSIQVINQITSALELMDSENPLDSNIFEQFFVIITDCWLSMEFEPTAIILLTSALNALSKEDFLAKLNELSQNAFASGLSPIERVFILRVIFTFPSVAPSLLAHAYLNTVICLDLHTVRYAIDEFWKTKSCDPNFTEELQLKLIGARLLSSQVAPVLLSSFLTDWLQRLSCISSDTWGTVGFHLQRLLNNPSEQVRESALKCFWQLDKVAHPNFTYSRLSTLMETCSLHALGTACRLPQLEIAHFWSIPSIASALKHKQLSAAKILSQEEYANCLSNIFHVENTIGLNEIRFLAIDAATTLIHDKLRTLGTIASTLDDIIQRLTRDSINPQSNIAVMSFLYSLHTLIMRIHSQYPELQVSFPSAIPFFLSKRFVYDGFFDKIKSQRLRLAFSSPSAIQRSVFFSEFSNEDLASVAVPFCWALKQSHFLKMNINCISTALVPESANDKGRGLSVLIDAIKYHSQNNYEAAIGCYFNALQIVSPEDADMSWNGAIQCIRTLQLWDSVQELNSSIDAIYQEKLNAAYPLQKLLLDSSFMLHTGNYEGALLLLDQNWDVLKTPLNLQSEPISMIISKCQLWIARLQCLRLKNIPAYVVSEAKEFISGLIDVSYMCSSYAENQELLAYNQLLSSVLEPSYDIEEYVSSPIYQSLPMLSELFMMKPSQQILSRLLLRAKESGNWSYVSRLLVQANTYKDDVIPELRHSVLICSKLTENTLLDFWNLSESSNHAEITLSLINLLLCSALHLLPALFHRSSTHDPFSLVDQAFQHCRDLSSGSHYAKWCVQQTGILDDGWFKTASGSLLSSGVQRMSSLLMEVLRAFIPNDEQLKDTIKTVCNQIVDRFKGKHGLSTSDLFSILSSSVSMEIDWEYIAAKSAHLSEVVTLVSRIPDLLSRAAGIISNSLANYYTYDDALLLVALLDIGFFVEDCRLPTSVWANVVPQLQAMLRRSDLSAPLKAKVHHTLLEVARNTPDFESIAFPLTAPKLENSHLEELANDLKQCKISLWADLCDFSNYMRKLSYFSDDKWLDLLSRLISEIPSRWRWWSEECEQGQLLTDSYGRIMQSILDAFNNAYLDVSSNWGCEHTRLFYEKFGHQIQSLWLHLCLPLQEASVKIDKKALLSAIIHQMRILKHDIQLLSKVDIRIVCPGINSSTKFAFIIPGMPAGSFPMTLANPMIEILKTKTRPRMISFIGSDGFAYSYLLKGKEDLNIDQRILQVASYVNDIMLKSAEAKSAGFLPIPTYSVTCLSSEVGLISIVPETISLFRLNRFGPGSDRDSTGSQALDDNDHKDIAESTPAQIYLFNLHKVLEERKLSPKTPRSEWPPDMFGELYDRLLSESDDAILEKRLYLSSLSPEQEFLKRVSYTATLAASSILGYLLGIGDRHPGNILLRIETGEVVHIDFAVSFDAGRSLRVPETVPFRLTPCLRKALGPFSLPTGQFSHIMDLTYKLCRQNKPYIITILRALWNHPIEGWNPRRRRIMKQDVDRAMVRNLIVARLQRSRSFLESLHNWALGSQSRWLELIAAYNQWAAAYNELALKTIEVSVLQHRISAAEQAILILPDLLETHNKTSSQLELMRGGPQEAELKEKLLELNQQQASARDLINSLPQFRRDLRALQDTLAALQSKKQNVVSPVLTANDLEIITTLQNLWANIRPLLSRISQNDFPVVQQLRSEWDQLQENIKVISSQSTPSVGTMKLIDGRRTFSSFFSTLKSFIKTDLPNLPSPDPRQRAAVAISNVAERLSSCQENLIQNLISEATDKEKLSRMFQGWAPWV